MGRLRDAYELGIRVLLSDIHQQLSQPTAYTIISEGLMYQRLKSQEISPTLLLNLMGFYPLCYLVKLQVDQQPDLKC